jgi:RNA polymerase sigma-70 factor (ECF subfamily)
MSNPSRPKTEDFETLLEGVLDSAYRTAYHLTHHRDDAQELVQEASLLAFRGFKRFEPGTNFKAWFMTILRNRFISEYRQRKRSIETVELEDAPELYLYTKSQELGLLDAAGDPAKQLVARLDAERVQEELKALPAEFRDVAMLYFTQDLSYQEIADVLEVPIGTVRSRLHRARRMLQMRLWRLAEAYGIVSADSSREE